MLSKAINIKFVENDNTSNAKGNKIIANFLFCGAFSSSHERNCEMDKATNALGLTTYSELDPLGET
jgi:hypothetical protein